MAQELKIRVSLSNEIFGELKNLEKKINDFAQRVNKSLKANFNINPALNLGGVGSANDPTAQIQKSIDKINVTIRKTAAQVENTIKDITDKVDSFFDHVFVGIDNIFSFGRRVRLQVGSFLGFSQATLTVLINDVVKLLRIVLPGLTQSAQVVNQIEGQARKFFTSPELKGLGRVIGVKKLPLLLEIRLFFEEVRRFFGEAIAELKTVAQLLKFAFNISDEAFDAISQKARKQSKSFTEGIDEIRYRIFNTVRLVERRLTTISKIIRSIAALVIIPAKIVAGTIKGIFGAISLVGKIGKGALSLLFGSKEKKQEETAEQRLARLQKERAERGKEILNLNRETAAQLKTIADRVLIIVKQVGESGVNFNQLLKNVASLDAALKSVQDNLSKGSEKTKVNFQVLQFILGTMNDGLKEIVKNVQSLDKTAKATGDNFKSVFTGDKIQQFGVAIAKGQERVAQLREQLEKARQEVQKTPEPVFQFNDALKKVNVQGRLIEPMEKTLRLIVDIVEQAKNIDLSKFAALPKFQFGTKDKEFLNQIQSVFTSIARSQFQEKDPFRLQAAQSAQTNVKKLIELFSLLGRVVGDENKELLKFGQTLAKSADFSKFGEKTQEEVRKVFKAFTGEELKKNSQLRSFGGAVNQVLGEAIRTGDKSALQKAIRDLTTFLGSTIPKQKRLVDSGKTITVQLAEGMRQGKVVLDKAANESAETIGAYFPQSPAALGVLRKLPIMGKVINTQLAQGMLSNLGVLANAVSKMAQIIFAPIKVAVEQAKRLASGFVSTFNEVADNAANIGDIATATGTAISEINAVDQIFRQVGQTAKDNAVVFSRIQRTLNEVDPEREGKLKQIGIDLDEVRESGAPVVGLFEEVAEVLQRVPPGSAEARTALEALGLRVDSKLVGVLRRGGEEIDEIIQQAQFFGVAVNSKVIEVSQELRGAFANLTKIFDSLKADFIGEILPVVSGFLDEVIQFFNENADKIRQFFIFVGRAVGNLISLTIAYIKLLIREPRKAIDIGKKLLVAAIKLVRDSVTTAIKKISKNFTDEVKYKFLAALNGLKDSAINVLILIGEQADLRVAKLLLLIEKAASNIDTLIFSVGDSFLSTTVEVAKRWLKLAGAVLGELLLSAENLILNIRDRISIFFLGIKREALQTLSDTISEIPESVREFFEIPDFSGGVADVDREIQRLESNIAARNNLPGFFERAAAAVSTVAQEVRSVDDLIAEIDEKIAESNAKFAEGIASNFESAFADAERLIDATREATGGLFDEEALAAYREAFEEAAATMVEAVEGTALEGPLRTLIDELSLSYLEDLQELKDAAPDSILPDSGEQDETLSFFDALAAKIAEVGESLSSLNDIFLAVGKTAGDFSSLFSDAFNASGKRIKELFFASKAAALAQVVINGAVAFTEALKLPFPLSIIQPPLVAAKAGLQAGIIARETIKGFAEGGEVAGEGTGDTVPAMLTPGEYVMPLDVVRANGVQFMEALRQGAIGAKDFVFSSLPSVIHSPTNRRFAEGGFVDNPSKSIANGVGAAMPRQEAPKMTQINVPDKEMVGRYLSTEKGRDIVLNVISDNAVEIKQIMGV